MLKICTYYLFLNGDAIEGTICSEEYDYFKKHLIEWKIYCFKGVHITLVDEKFKLVPHHYKLSFTDDTTVVYILNHDDNIPFQCHFIKKLSNIGQFLHQDI